MNANTLHKQYDDIIIGAGSTGAVIAARLSQDPDRRVLLIEAGPDFGGHSDLPAELLNPHHPVTNGYNWDIRAHLQEEGLSLQGAGKAFAAADNVSRLAMAKTALQSAYQGSSVMSRFDYPVGRVVGGSSAVNGAIAMRGTIDDYAQWEALGLPLWSWDNVLSGFKRVENDKNNVGEIYSQQGPVAIERVQESDLYPLQRDFVTISQAIGYSYSDVNDPYATGLSLVARNIHNGQRISTASAYIDAARSRSNFTLMANTIVDHVLIQNHKAVGVVIQQQGRKKTIAAHRVIVSGGAIHSPTILMRSGIGDPAQLQAHGIDTVVSLAGVGKNLMDHAAVGIWAVPKDGYCQLGEEIHQTMLRYTSKVVPALRNDMSLFMLSSVDTAQFPELKMALGSSIAMAISAILGKPQSRGAVTLASSDCHVSPVVTLNCAQDKNDREKLMEGVRLAWYMLQQPLLKIKYEKIFAWNQRIIDSDKLLGDAIKTFVRGSWHASGTAKMGQENDPMAVVNQCGNVFGVDQLIVADASIMPTIPSVPTNLSCMMMGEVLADILKQ